MERLGIGPEVCLGRNPKLVFARVTGWGQTGPLAQSAGHDINYIALAGILGRIGRPGERPVVPLNLIGDYGGGALFLAFGIMAAIWEAHSSGLGQVIDAAMIDGAASLMTKQFGWNASGELQRPGNNLLDGGAYFYDTYECADGRYVAVGAIEEKFHDEMLSVLGIDPAIMPTQHDRDRWPEARLILAERFLSRTRDEWAKLAEGTDACITAVLELSEAPDHPHALARNSFMRQGDAMVPAPAPRFSRTPAVSPGEDVDRLHDCEDVLARWRVKNSEMPEAS
jgi:alpha-methylacyl-CoA racemase